MLWRIYSFSFDIARFVIRGQPLRLLVTKSSNYYNRRGYDDDDDKKIKKINEGDEGNIYLHKSRGQHILTNPRVLDTIVRKADVRSTDTILEIGPGTGNLTLKLLQVAQKVVAIEIDKRMVEILINRASNRGLENRLSVICKDALKTELPQFDAVVANIPYGISSPLIAKFVFGTNSFRSATLLLQKEFARRLLANPGDSQFNRLAVNVKLVADIEFIMDVSKRDFIPCPKVDSSVVKIHPKVNVPSVDMNEWWAFTRTCFSKKNKTLGATFKQKKKAYELLRRSEMVDQHKDKVMTNCIFDDETNKSNDEEEVDEEHLHPPCFEKDMNLFRDKIVEVLRTSGFEEKRPSKLSNEELLYLLSLFNQAGIHFHDKAK
ncbi:hypothetical protein Scep_028916 [Stephania cephalantha]|uniref:rRNA adenine N(6)-methyltransferase n=1 Tax=Stephania cephalantha TaxID=152367 RepID=A0AAP0HK25_9MAGN